MQVGQRWIGTKRSGDQMSERTWFVTRIAPDAAELCDPQKEGDGYRMNPWKAPTKRVDEGGAKVVGHETLTISGRSFPCVILETTSGTVKGAKMRFWVHVGEDGKERFPGQMKWTNADVVMEEFVRIEPPAP